MLEEEEDPESIWPKFKKKFEPWSEELREYMDEHLKDYLGVEKVIWVKEGIDRGDDGHIDDVATFIAAGVISPGLTIPSIPSTSSATLPTRPSPTPSTPTGRKMRSTSSACR